MPEELIVNTEKFCWVKAVMQPPSCDTLSTASMNECSKPWTLDCHCGPAEMPPPPSPHKGIDASKLDPIGVRGGGTPPPSNDSIPKTPADQAAFNLAAGGSYWQVSSFAPGAGVPPSGPTVSIVFLPIQGTRLQAMAWRLKNPEWFRDAVAVTLLNHTY